MSAGELDRVAFDAMMAGEVSYDDRVSEFGSTQPSCRACWYQRNPTGEPDALRHRQRETCVHCGRETRSGIYVNVDPEMAVHPTLRSAE